VCQIKHLGVSHPVNVVPHDLVMRKQALRVLEVVSLVKLAMSLGLLPCLQMCVMLCADHGPAVSGAHNTIVTARAGKDLVSSLVSGMYTLRRAVQCISG
jgi:hypothetical protein